MNSQYTQNHKFLFYSPYSKWELHGMFDITLYHALISRGYDARILFCDALYLECDMFWKATTPRPELGCSLCQYSVTELAYKMGVQDYQWLGRYLIPQEIELAKVWSEQLKTQDLLTAKYENWFLGEWVKSSVYSHFRINHIDLNQTEIAHIYRRYLYSSLIACFSFERLLLSYQPQTLIVFNGRLSSTRIAFELARAKNIEVLCHERGLLKGSFEIFKNEISCDSTKQKTSWQLWEDIPLRKKELLEITQFMQGRRYGQNMHWKPFSTPPGDAELVKSQLDIKPEQQVWVLFTSTLDEYVAMENQSDFSQFDWIEQTIDYVSQYQEIFLIIRTHPNTGSKTSLGTNEEELAYYHDLKKHLPANVKLVMPDDSMSSYSLMDLATIGLVFVSTVGLEMACQGKPVVVASTEAVISHTSFVTTIDGQKDYGAVLDKLRAQPESHDPSGVQRAAFRCAYHLFFRLPIPFPLIYFRDSILGDPTYQKTDELTFGRDSYLDRICHVLTSRSSPVLEPDPFDLLTRELDELTWYQMSGTLESENSLAIEKRIKSELQFLELPTDNESVNELVQTTHINFDIQRVPRVSVIVLDYYSGQYLKDSITSLLNQTLQEFEVLIVNDYNSETQRVSEQLIAANPGSLIRLINYSSKKSVVLSENIGLDCSKSHFIVILDSKDILRPNYLQACVDKLIANPSFFIAYPRTQTISGINIESPEPLKPYDIREFVQNNFLPLSCLFTKELWSELRGFSSSNMWHFWLKALKAGFFAIGVEETILEQRVFDDDEAELTNVTQEQMVDFSETLLNNRIKQFEEFSKFVI